MVASLDGRIITGRWGKKPHPKIKAYETTAATFKAQAWLCGRVAMEKDFTKGRKPDPQPGTAPADGHDFVAGKAATAFAIAINAHGKLGWAAGYLDEDHLISVLTASSAVVLEQGEQPGPPAKLQLKREAQLPGDLVWLRYEVSDHH